MIENLNLFEVVSFFLAEFKRGSVAACALRDPSLNTQLQNMNKWAPRIFIYSKGDGIKLNMLLIEKLLFSDYEFCRTVQQKEMITVHSCILNSSPNFKIFH